MTTNARASDSTETGAFLHSRAADRIAREAGQMTVDDVPPVPAVPRRPDGYARDAQQATLTAYQLVTTYMAERGSTSWRLSDRGWAELLLDRSTGGARRTALRRLERLEEWELVKITRSGEGWTVELLDRGPRGPRPGATTGGHEPRDRGPLDIANTRHVTGQESELEPLKGSALMSSEWPLVTSGETFRGDELGGGEGESSRPASSSRQEWQRLTASAVADLAGRQRPAPARPIEEQS